MPSKKIETGRSLVETLAVLVVIAILLLAGLAGYNFAIHKYKKDQTIKAVSELAVRYKLHPISKTGLIEIKSIYPEAERADAVNMKTADTDTGRVQLEVSKDNSYFAVVVNNILDDSCAEYLEKGEYDAALLLKGEKYDSESKKEYLALGKDFLKDFDLNKLTTEQKDKLRALTNGNTSKEDVINVICAGAPKAKTAAFVFGDKCPKRGASHYYEGKCWPCPKDEKEDKRGKCCSNFNECGYCEDTSDYYCLKNPSACHNNQPVCDADDSKQCVECTRQQDCDCKGTGLTCSNKHCCPVGQEWNGKGCVCPNGEDVCGTQCCAMGCSESDPGQCKKECTGAGNACQKCDDSTGTWIADSEKEGKEVQDVCHMCQGGNIILKEDGKDTIMDDGVHCCVTGEKWLEDQCCEPSSSDSSKCKKECTSERPNICYTCNDLTGDWELNPNQDKVCGAGTDQVCCKECNEDNTGCKLTCEGTAEDHPCKACDYSAGSWTQVDDTNVSGLDQCQKCEGGEIRIDTGKEISDCAKCGADGTLEENTTKAVPQCKKCDTTTGSSTIWQFVLKEVGKDVECSPECCATDEYCVNGNTCCTNDGENATTENPAVCASDNCCKSGNCSGLTATETGHCCATGEVWDEDSSACVTPVCQVTEGNACAVGSEVLAECCATGTCQLFTGKTQAYCCTNDGENATTGNQAVCTSNNCCISGNCSGLTETESGHCCAAGEKWLEEQCCIPSTADPTKCAQLCTSLGVISTKTAVSGQKRDLVCSGAAGFKHYGLQLYQIEAKGTYTLTSDMILTINDRCMHTDNNYKYNFSIKDMTTGQNLNVSTFERNDGCTSGGKKCRAVGSVKSGRQSFNLLAGHTYQIDISFYTACPDLNSDVGVSLTCSEKACSSTQTACECNHSTGKWYNPTGKLWDNGHCCATGEKWLEGQCCIPSTVDPTKCKEDQVCTTLYRYANQSLQTSEYKSGDCCEPQQKILQFSSNATLFGGFKGVAAGDYYYYYCCPSDKVAGEKCCASNQTPAEGQCCDTNKVYTENGVQKCCNGTVYDNEGQCCPSDKVVSGNQCCSSFSHSFYFHGGNGIGTQDVGSYTVPSGDCGSGQYTATLSAYCIDDAAYVYLNGSNVANLSACNVACNNNYAYQCYSTSWSETVNVGDVISVKVWGKSSKKASQGDTDFQGTLTLTPQ